jgi:hypothetical protein
MLSMRAGFSVLRRASGSSKRKRLTVGQESGEPERTHRQHGRKSMKTYGVSHGLNGAPKQASGGKDRQFVALLPVFVAVSFVALAVVTVTGIGARGSTRQASREPLVGGPAQTAPSAGVRTALRSGGSRFYLVSTQEQARAAEAMLQDDAQTEAGAVAPQTQQIVAMVSSAEDLTRIEGAAAELDDAMIIDLRSSEVGSKVALMPGESTSGDNVVHLYLVASAVKANDLVTGRMNDGVPPLPAIVVQSGSPEEMQWARAGLPGISLVDIVNSSDEEARTQARLATAGRLRQAAADPELSVVDLRSSEAGSNDTPMTDETTYYLVNSAEEATLVASVLQKLFPDGMPPARFSPHYVSRIAADATEEDRVRGTVDAANHQVAAYGEPGFRIVDLRLQENSRCDGEIGVTG